MDEDSGQFSEIFIQEGVLVKSHAPCNKDIDFRHNLGSLSLVQYASALDKCIEWHQCDVSIEADDQEWAIVNECKRPARTISESKKTPIIQIELKNLMSFCLSKSNQQLTLVENGGTTNSTFHFQHGNADRFVACLKSVLKTTKKDPNLYLVTEQPEVKNLEQSFAELNLFDDDRTRSYFLSSFVKNLHKSPYETAMSAFAKVADIVLYSQQHQSEEVEEWLNRSLTSDEMNDISGKIPSGEYELITKRLPLPPRTMPLRCPPLSSEQWLNFFDDEGRIQEHEIVKEIVFHGGVSPSIRKEVWKYLTGYYPWNATHLEREALRKKKVEEYYSMKLQWKSMTPGQEDRFAGYKERKSLIEKDVFRTDRTMDFFAGDNNPNLELLQDILMTYIMYNFDLGYVQGMSDLLSPLLVQINDEIDTFWCFVGFMDRVGRNFDLDQAGMKEQLTQLYCILCSAEPELAHYLDQHESNNMSFCFRWLIVLFKREFSYEDIFLLWEVLWTESLCKNFHLLVCVAILETEKDALMSNNFGFTEILKHVNDLANKINLDLILRKAEGIYLQLSTAAKISPATRDIIGLEPIPEPEDSARDINGAENGEYSNENAAAGLTDSVNGNLDRICYSVDTQELEFERSISSQFH